MSEIGHLGGYNCGHVDKGIIGTINEKHNLQSVYAELLLKATLMHFVNTAKNSIMCHGFFGRINCKVIIRHWINLLICYTVSTSYFCPNTHTALHQLCVRRVVVF